MILLDEKNLSKKFAFSIGLNEDSEKGILLQCKLKDEYEIFKNKVATLNNEQKFEMAMVIACYCGAYEDIMDKLFNGEVEEETIEEGLEAEEVIYTAISNGMFHLDENELSILEEILSIEI